VKMKNFALYPKYKLYIKTKKAHKLYHPIKAKEKTPQKTQPQISSP